ncbi:MAG TPA: hypothetical protein VGB37_05165 [Candidatus Lokiarchaeia archaeon]
MEKYGDPKIDEKLGIKINKRATCFYVARIANLFGNDVPMGVGSTEERARANLLLTLMQYDDLYGSQVEDLLESKQQKFVMS